MTHKQFAEAYATAIHVAKSLTPSVQRAIREMIYFHIATGAPVDKFEKAACSVFRVASFG